MLLGCLSPREELANYDCTGTYANEPIGQYRKDTTPVGSFPPNAFGLYDLHGNVGEWCEDTWHSNYRGAPTDSNAWTDKSDDNNSKSIYLLRGGSWLDFPESCRSAIRDYRNLADGIYDTLGFRVVCVPGLPRS